MTLPRATLSALARLYLAEADHGAAVRSECALMVNPLAQLVEHPSEEQAAHLRDLARAADHLTWLHQRASTPAEIRELLTAKGRPGLALLVGSLRPSENPAALCEMFARNVERGTGTGDGRLHGEGYFEKEEKALWPFLTEDERWIRRAKVIAALRWAADAYRRMPKPTPSLDSQPRPELEQPSRRLEDGSKAGRDRRGGKARGGVFRKHGRA